MDKHLEGFGGANKGLPAELQGGAVPMSKSPSAAEFSLAAELLDVYEAATGDDETRPMAQRMAAWLREQSNAKFLRETAREARIPVGALRAAMKRNGE